MSQWGRVPQMSDYMFPLRLKESSRRLLQINFPPIRAQDLVSGGDFLRSLGLEEHNFPLGWDERDAKI